MAIAFRAAGTESHNTGGGAATPGIPAGTTTNDIMVALVASTRLAALGTPSGWTKKLETDNSTEHKQSVYWKRAGSSESAPSFSGQQFDIEAQIVSFSGCTTTGDPFSAAQAQANASSTTVTAPAITPANANEMILFLITWSTTGASTSTFSAYSGTNPTFSEAFDSQFGGGVVHNLSMACAYGLKTDTTSTGSRTATASAADLNTGALLSLIPDTGGSGGTTTKVMSDTLTVTDAALDPTYRVRQMTELTTVVDSVVKSVISAGGTVYTKVMTDALIAADTFIDWLRRVRDQIDTITINEGNTFRTAIITANESIDLSDGFVTWRRLRRVMGDNLDIIDGFSKTLSGAGIVYAKVMSDTITLIDDAGRRWRLRFTQLTDAVGLSDQVIDYLRAVRSLGDAVELSDGTVTIRRTVKTMDESIEVSDEKISTLYLDQISNTSFTFGASGPPFRFGGM